MQKGDPRPAARTVTFAAYCTWKNMRDALRRFEERAPEIVFEWNDGPTGAKGWVVK